MKFTVDQSAKKITLIGDAKFSDLEEIKKLLGADIENWVIESEKVFVDKWNYYPVYPTYPLIRPYYYKPYEVFCGDTSGTCVMNEQALGNATTNLLISQN